MNTSNTGKYFSNALLVRHLTPCEKLRTFIEFCSQFNRFFVISCIPHLEYLDDRMITDDQRNEAIRLYGRSFYKVLLEEQIPEFLDRIMGKLKGMGIVPGEQTRSSGEELECSQMPSSATDGDYNTQLVSIPVNPQPVRLNSSDSDSSFTTPRRKQRNLVI